MAESYAYDAGSIQTVAVPSFECRHCLFKKWYTLCINVDTIVPTFTFKQRHYIVRALLWT